SNEHDYLQSGEPTELPVETLKRFPELVLPLIASQTDADLFAKFREAPSLADRSQSFWAQSVQGDFNSTTGKKVFDLDPNAFEWPVYKGASFELWNPMTGVFYGSIESRVAMTGLDSLRASARRRSGSVFSVLPEDWFKTDGTLPCLAPRIAYRRI